MNNYPTTETINGTIEWAFDITNHTAVCRNADGPTTPWLLANEDWEIPADLPNISICDACGMEIDNCQCCEGDEDE